MTYRHKKCDLDLMKVAIFLGQRLSFRSQQGRAAAPGVAIAVTGIALSLIIMLLSIAVVTGFKKEITRKLEGFNAQISLYAPDYSENRARTPGISLTPELLHTISETLPEAIPTIAIHQPAIFKTDESFQGVIIKGMSPEANWDFIRENMIDGTLPESDSGPNPVVISSTTASALKIKTGDRLLTHFIDNNSVKTRKFTVSGIYDSHFSDFDRMYAFTTIAPMQKLCKVDSITGSVIEINGLDTRSITESAQSLYGKLLYTTMQPDGGHIVYDIDTVTNTCSMFFNWLDLLDTNVWVILALMACVSAFTLISSMFILILERVRTIGLLKALGATDTLIRHTFIYLAQRLVIRGLIIGNIAGISLLYLQRTFRFLPLDADTYYLNFVPVHIDWTVILSLNVAVLVISWLVLILPSHIVAKLSPASTIRYE